MSGAALVNESVMRTICVVTMKLARAHQRLTTVQHPGNDLEFDRQHE